MGGFTIVDALNDFLYPPSVTPTFPSVFPSPTFTTSRELDRSSAEPLSRELSCLVMSLELSPVASVTRRFSPLNSTRRPLTRPAPELSQYENAEVEFEPSQPLFVEPFETYAALGRIAVMDSNRLKMLGKVTGVVHAEL